MTVPPSVKEVTVRVARADERRKWDALMFEHHYLRFIQISLGNQQHGLGRQGDFTLEVGAGLRQG